MSKQMYYFYKNGCPPCERIKPYILNMGNQCASNNINPRSFNIEEANSMSVAAAYNVNATPTIIFVYNGQPVSRIDGANQELIYQGFQKLAFM
jgi:thioredoxin-like negative regulator of GroEL